MCICVDLYICCLKGMSARSSRRPRAQKPCVLFDETVAARRRPHSCCVCCVLLTCVCSVYGMCYVYVVWMVLFVCVVCYSLMVCCVCMCMFARRLTFVIIMWLLPLVYSLASMCWLVVVCLVCCRGAETSVKCLVWMSWRVTYHVALWRASACITTTWRNIT